MKYVFLLIITLLSFGHTFSQAQFQVYEQVIPGSGIRFDMIALPGGTFNRGSLYGRGDESPVHQVQIAPFYMSKHEVTWDLYELFLYKDFEAKDLPGELPDNLDAMTRPTRPYIDMTFGMGKTNKPALGMTQYNAIQFCKWLYLKTGLYYRLPTEAEWEYACRAGTNTEYSFGNDPLLLDQYAWYAGNSTGITQEIGTRRPNAWGLYDMHGNVAEWTYDQYDPGFYKQFEGKTVINPTNPPLRLYPISVRGGSYEDEAGDLRAAARMPSEAGWKQLDPQVPKSNWWFTDAPFVGIRLVRPLHPPSEQEILAYYDKAPIADY